MQQQSYYFYSKGLFKTKGLCLWQLPCPEPVPTTEVCSTSTGCPAHTEPANPTVIYGVSHGCSLCTDTSRCPSNAPSHHILLCSWCLPACSTQGQGGCVTRTGQGTLPAAENQSPPRQVKYCKCWHYTVRKTGASQQTERLQPGSPFCLENVEMSVNDILLA